MNNFLIPANSKKSMLIFGLFNRTDAWIFGSGIVATLLLLLFLPVEQLVPAIIAIAPGLICGFLVLPIPNYHNVRTVIKSAYRFFTTRQKFIWKGWCFIDEENKK